MKPIIPPPVVNGPAPQPADGTANLLLLNMTNQPAAFHVSGNQAGIAVTVTVNVPPFAFTWSIGWMCGADKMICITTPFSSKSVCPFVTTEFAAIYQP